jgi:surfeit locus 1 family protein
MAYSPDETLPGRSRRARLALTGAMAFVTLVFLALGTWQVQRLFWKLDLIERVDARINAEPQAPPTPDRWASINAGDHEYLRVSVRGQFRHSLETLVQAVTELGPGFWVLTPLELGNGTTVLVNRGFVPGERRNPAARATGQVEGVVGVTGLLRLSEPGGGFLRKNDPGSGRWYSRDVEAIATAKGLEEVAPYFIDADAKANPGGFPVGGLTVVRFRNSHLVYAATWYILAAMSAAAGIYVLRRPSP